MHDSKKFKSRAHWLWETASAFYEYLIADAYIRFSHACYSRYVQASNKISNCFCRIPKTKRLLTGTPHVSLDRHNIVYARTLLSRRASVRVRAERAHTRRANKPQTRFGCGMRAKLKFAADLCLQMSVRPEKSLCVGRAQTDPVRP